MPRIISAIIAVQPMATARKPMLTTCAATRAIAMMSIGSAYTGARIHQRLPDTLIRRLMGVLVVAIGARYLWSGLG